MDWLQNSLDHYTNMLLCVFAAFGQPLCSLGQWQHWLHWVGPLHTQGLLSFSSTHYTICTCREIGGTSFRLTHGVFFIGHHCLSEKQTIRFRWWSCAGSVTEVTCIMFMLQNSDCFHPGFQTTPGCPTDKHKHSKMWATYISMAFD